LIRRIIGTRKGIAQFHHRRNRGIKRIPPANIIVDLGNGLVDEAAQIPLGGC
jgi:hypothetical protein